jgi:hypothetical protein
MDNVYTRTWDTAKRAVGGWQPGVGSREMAASSPGASGTLGRWPFFYDVYRIDTDGVVHRNGAAPLKRHQLYCTIALG